MENICRQGRILGAGGEYFAIEENIESIFLGLIAMVYLRWGRREGGFTLLEILLVLLLLGILVQGVMPHFAFSGSKVRQNIHEANIKRIEGAAQLYRLDVGSYPADVDALVEPPPGIRGWRGPYLKQWPTNPFDPTEPYVLNSIGQVRQSR